MNAIAVDADWPAAFVGLPYSSTGEGPDAFHCWALVRHVEREIFGRELPKVPHDQGIVAQAAAIAGSAERRRWQRVAPPIDGDVVLMGRTRTPTHVGVWASADGGGVLHCLDPIGVVFHTPSRLLLEHWHIAGFYRFNGDAA